MIKKLRIKFTVLAMLSVSIVLLVILGTVNVMNYRNVVAEADQVMEMIAGNKGRFPQLPPNQNGGQNREQSRKTVPDEKHRRKDLSKMSPELPYELRYFSVLLDDAGACLDTDIGRIAAVDASEAEEYAREAVKSYGEKAFGILSL